MSKSIFIFAAVGLVIGLMFAYGFDVITGDSIEEEEVNVETKEKDLNLADYNLFICLFIVIGVILLLVFKNPKQR